jgi:molybdopterin converting factor small subunit
VKISIPTPLRSYTGAARVEAVGATVGELVADLDRRHPGIRFRIIDEQDGIREHVRIFVNQQRAVGLESPVGPEDEIQILQAPSGG